MLATGIACCALGVALGIAACAFARRDPNRIANGFALAIGVLLVIDGLFYLVWATPLADTAAAAVLAVLYFARNALFALIGAALLVNGVRVVRREGLSPTHVLPFLWGFALLADFYWFTFGPGMEATGSELYILAITFLSIFVAYVPLTLFAAWLSNDICRLAPKRPQTEYVVALGCGIRRDGTVTPLLKGRLDAAIGAYEAGGRKAKIIVSGGKGTDEVVSEARAMANYLLSQGIPAEDVILEDASTTTQENLRNSRAIMERLGWSGQCTVATSSYHCLRAAMYARREGIEVSCVGGRTAPFYYPAAFFREYAALVMSNRATLAAFLVIAAVRFVLILTGIMPEGFI